MHRNEGTRHKLSPRKISAGEIVEEVAVLPLAFGQAEAIFFCA